MSEIVADHLYVRSTGCNCRIVGVSGYVTGLHKQGKHLIGTFVKVPIYDGAGPMLYARLGRTTDDRGHYREVVSVRAIDRDEFDRLNELDVLRRDLGWR